MNMIFKTATATATKTNKNNKTIKKPLNKGSIEIGFRNGADTVN